MKQTASRHPRSEQGSDNMNKQKFSTCQNRSERQIRRSVILRDKSVERISPSGRSHIPYGSDDGD